MDRKELTAAQNWRAHAESEAALQVHLKTHKDELDKVKSMLEGDPQRNVCPVVGMA